jgi:hypothetical protein
MDFDFPGALGALTARNSKWAAFAESGHNLRKTGLLNLALANQKKPATMLR